MKIALGYYGKDARPINPDVLALAEKLGGKPRFTGRPADMLEPRMPKLRAELGAKRPSRRRRALRHLRDVSAGAGETLQGARRQGGGPAAAPAMAAASPPEVKAPAPAALTIPGTSKKISQLALTIDGSATKSPWTELA